MTPQDQGPRTLPGNGGVRASRRRWLTGAVAGIATGLGVGLGQGLPVEGGFDWGGQVGRQLRFGLVLELVLGLDLGGCELGRGSVKLASKAFSTVQPWV